MTVWRLTLLDLAARRRRIAFLLAFGAVFLAAGAAARMLAGDADGHVDLDRLFAVGGYALASGLLLLGWLLGRFPLIATLVLMAGFFSADRDEGHARLFAVRPVSLPLLYGMRFVVLAAVATVLSALVMPLFDVLLLGTWAGPATFVLIVANVLVYGGLTAVLSLWTRADAWLALLVALIALVWDATRRAGALAVPPFLREIVSFVLPPQGALLRLESAFGDIAPVPVDAFAFAAGYGLVLVLIAALTIGTREL